MIPHDILSLYSAKMVEYGIAVLFMLLFIPFWRFVQGPSRALATAAGSCPSSIHAPGRRKRFARRSILASTRATSRSYLVSRSRGSTRTVLPRISPLDAGRWRVEGLMFHMSGRWLLEFELRTATGTQRLFDDVQIR